MKLIRKRNVGCVGATTCDQRTVFEARNRFSDEGHADVVAADLARSRLLPLRACERKSGKNQCRGKSQSGKRRREKRRRVLAPTVRPVKGMIHSRTILSARRMRNAISAGAKSALKASRASRHAVTIDMEIFSALGFSGVDDFMAKSPRRRQECEEGFCLAPFGAASPGAIRVLLATVERLFT